MAQQPAAAQNVREEERVLGITYDRAVGMVPRLVREAVGAEVTELGDGYYVAQIEDGSTRRDVTVRLGREGADTRVSVRVETYAPPMLTAMIIVAAIVTMGIGILLLIPWIQSSQRKESRARELAVHRTFRALEDAVASQGVSNNYRVAPGADANVRVGEEAEASEEVEDAANDRARAR